MSNQFLHITSLVNIQVKLILNRLYKAQATNIICLVFFSPLSPDAHKIMVKYL